MPTCIFKIRASLFEIINYSLYSFLIINYSFNLKARFQSDDLRDKGKRLKDLLKDLRELEGKDSP